MVGVVFDIALALGQHDEGRRVGGRGVAQLEDTVLSTPIVMYLSSRVRPMPM